MKLHHLILLLFIVRSYDHSFAQIKNSLNKAGNNAQELETVIKHYKNQGDNEKLNAAYFLIANMEKKRHLHQ